MSICGSVRLSLDILDQLNILTAPIHSVPISLPQVLLQRRKLFTQAQSHRKIQS